MNKGEMNMKFKLMEELLAKHESEISKIVDAEYGGRVDIRQLKEICKRFAMVDNAPKEMDHIEDFTEIEYKGSKGSHDLFASDDKEIRTTIGYSEHLGQRYITIEQYNHGWREVTTLHL